MHVYVWDVETTAVREIIHGTEDFTEEHFKALFLADLQNSETNAVFSPIVTNEAFEDGLTAPHRLRPRSHIQSIPMLAARQANYVEPAAGANLVRSGTCVNT